MQADASTDARRWGARHYTVLGAVVIVAAAMVALGVTAFKARPETSAMALSSFGMDAEQVAEPTDDDAVDPGEVMAELRASQTQIVEQPLQWPERDMASLRIGLQLTVGAAQIDTRSLVGADGSSVMDYLALPPQAPPPGAYVVHPATGAISSGGLSGEGLAEARERLAVPLYEPCFAVYRAVPVGSGEVLDVLVAFSSDTHVQVVDFYGGALSADFEHTISYSPFGQKMAQFSGIRDGRVVVVTVLETESSEVRSAIRIAELPLRPSPGADRQDGS